LNLALNFWDKSQQNPQIFIYSAGVGTTGASSQLPGGALGEGLDEMILNAYINLASNYEENDKVYLFGFSRGAVAARALCGLISHSGLLKANSSWLIEHAWRYFVGGPGGVPYLEHIGKDTYQDIEIEFLGVWDTVSGPFRQNQLFER